MPQQPDEALAANQSAALRELAERISTGAISPLPDELFRLVREHLDRWADSQTLEAARTTMPGSDRSTPRRASR